MMKQAFRQHFFQTAAFFRCKNVFFCLKHVFFSPYVFIRIVAGVFTQFFIFSRKCEEGQAQSNLGIYIKKVLSVKKFAYV